MKRENNKKFKKRRRNQKRSLTCRVLSMMFAIVLFSSTVLINTDYVSQASSFDDMVDMVAVEEDSAAVDISEETGDDLGTDVNFKSEEGSAETYSESDDLGSSDVDFSSGENMFTDGTSESSGSAPTEEAAQPVSCIVNLKNETIEVKAEAPAGVLPNGTKMIVKAVENDTEDAELTDQYNKLAAKITEQLQSQGKNLDGFLAYNVSFTDADGNPVEPAGKVNYSFTYKEASSPELTDPAASTVTAAMIRTNKETSELELTELKAEEDQLTVETNESRQLTKAAFQSAATAAYTFVWSSTPAADDNENNENNEENGEVNNEEVKADTNTENTEENGEETNTENNVENSEAEQNPEEAPDQEQIKMIRIITDEVNLREAPSTEAEVIAAVDRDAQLPLLETVTGEDEFTWYKVSYEETEAYVRSDMAEVVETEEQGTENEDPNEEEAEVQVEDEVTYSRTIDNVVVTATAAKNVLPEDAQFVVTPIESDNAQYEDIAARLEEKAENEEYSIAGFLAYDIYFLNNAGEKINPEDGKVKISMEYQNATAPEEVKESDAVQMDAEEEETSQENTEAKELSVSVMHFVEENGEVTSVVDMTKENSATVETNEAGEVQKAEFETESFSTFTITWKKNNGSYKNLRVHLVCLDDNGEYKEIPGTANKYYNVLADTANIKLADLGETYTTTGYQYSKALAQDTTTEIAYISYNSSSGGNSGWFWADANRNWTYLNNNADNYNIYLVYNILSGVLVMDKIADDGSLEAKYTPENDDTQTTVTSYEWYKSDSEKGECTKVEKINYQAGTSTVSNISDDGTKLYPAYDDGARKWYKVKVTLSDNTTVVESSPYQVAYYNQLQNGSFEEPTYSDRTNQISNANYATDGVWQTTGTNNGLDIEIVRQNIGDGATAYDWWTETGNNTSLNRDTHNWTNAAYEGSQFAELNCEAAGALYQDVLTIPGTSLNYWLAHRARGNNADSMQNDTMYLVIMPKSEAVDDNNYELTTQTQLETKLTQLLGRNLNDSTEKDGVLYDSNGIKVLRVTSTNQRWQYINEVNGYTPTSSLTRFFFMSGDTASGDNTVGNFLDNVGFSQKLPPVADDEFTLQIKKNFEGLGSADIEKVKENISFKIAASEAGNDLTDDQINALFGCNTISGKEMTQQLDGSLQYTIANKKIGINDTYQVKITEEDAGLSGYTLNTSATTSILTKGNDTPEETNGSTFGLQGKKTATVTFTNTYEADNQKQIHFTKIWDDSNNTYNTRPENLTVTLHATYDANGKSNDLDLTNLVKPGVTINLNADSDWKCSWTVPVYYALKNGNKAKINYTVTEGENTSDYVYKAVTDDGKAISGNGSDYHDQFNNSGITTPGNTTSTQSAPKKSRVRAASNNDELATVAATNGTTTSDDLGEPAHKKYITYNSASGDYTLHLDVTGAKGSAKGVDVLFVIDTSGSMGSGYNNLLPTVKTLLTKEDGLVDKIFSKTENVNNVAMVSFSDMEHTIPTSWYGASSKDGFKSAVNSLSASGGTNWTYAMIKAHELLDGRSNSSNEKVVIFLSDGKPTYSCEKEYNYWGESYWDETGNGSKTKDKYYTEAAKQVTGSLASAKMYSVYLTSDTMKGMEKFSKEVKNSSLVDGTNLESALTGILNKVIPTYKNVTITDTLSNYVDFAETTPTITVTKKSAAVTTTLAAGTDYTLNRSGKTVTVQLLNGNSLEDGATYTVSFRVKPSDAANEYYKNNQSYPHTGDAGTGTTSADKAGFYSNDNAQTNISYEIDGTSDGIKTASYIRPVVQVTTHTLTYTKVWNYPSSVEEPTQDVTLNVRYSDGTTKKITLTKAKEYTYNETVPVTQNIVSVIESPVADYEASYSITDNGTKAVVTNNYNKVTASNITVIKKWSGNGPQPAITVGLYRSVDGAAAEKREEVTLNFANNWTYTWENLPQSEGSATNVKNYSYAVREESIPSNYQSSISYDYGNDTITATITNTYDPNCADENYYIANVLQTEKLHIIKKWNDGSNEANIRPDTLSVTVNGMSFTLSGTGDQWTQDATILKKKNPTYNATENLISPDYEMISSTVTSADDGKNIEFVNQLKTKEITVHKVWNDGNAENRPTSVKIRLDRRISNKDNWKEYATYTFTEEYNVNGVAWTYVIPNLLTTYEYRVVELNNNDDEATAENNGYYIPSIAQDDDTFTITNTLKWSAVKTSDGENSVGLSGAEFELKKDTTLYATGTSGDGGAITWKPAIVNGDTVNLNALNGEFKIYETKAPAGYMKNDSGWTVTFNNGLLTKLDNASVPGTAEAGVVITLTNQKVYTLPSTGGNGIYWYMISGMVLMSTAAWILYKNKCKEVLGK